MVQSIITRGIVIYIHMAFANSADGTEDFTLDPLDEEVYAYEGTYTDEDPTESTDPADYTWTAVDPVEVEPYSQKLEDVADEVVVNIDSAEEQIGAVDSKATAAQQVASATANYFFADASGTHVASVAGDANSGFNTLGTSTGFAIRNGTDTLSAWSSSAIEFYDNGATIASFGDTVTLGDDSKGHAEIDFNSFELYNSDGTAKVFEVGDLRNASGVATLTETFTVTETTTDFLIAFVPYGTPTVTVDGVAATFTRPQARRIVLDTAAEAGQVVIVDYSTKTAVTSLTFGVRSGNTGANSVVLGEAEASGELSLAEGYGTIAGGYYTHAEGRGSVAKTTASHAEGDQTQATALGAHAEGGYTVASGSGSHAEGFHTTASGQYSHAEGWLSEASHISSHAEGISSVASGREAHAQNSHTIAQGFAQTALGHFNTAQGTATSYVSSDHAVIVGNGTGDNARSNAATLDWNGDLWVAGTVTDGDGNVLGVDIPSGFAPQRIDNTTDISDVTVSGITVNTSPVVIRSGYTCTLDCEYTLTAALASETTVATGLPPRVAGAIVDVMQSKTSYARPLRAIVNTSGDLKLRYGAAGTYWIHMTYISSVHTPLNS